MGQRTAADGRNALLAHAENGRRAERKISGRRGGPTCASGGGGAHRHPAGLHDFEYEETIADINRKLAGIETILLFPEPELTSISSTIVRELLQFGKDVTPFLPEGMKID